MNQLEQRIFSLKEEAPSDRMERRREPRVQVDRLVYVQTADTEGGHFEEIRSMRDLSRSGFYFTTSCASRNCPLGSSVLRSVCFASKIW